jgi:hypothetical protein
VYACWGRNLGAAGAGRRIHTAQHVVGGGDVNADGDYNSDRDYNDKHIGHILVDAGGYLGSDREFLISEHRRD